MTIMHCNNIYEIDIEKTTNSYIANINSEKSEHFITLINQNAFTIKHNEKNVNGYITKDSQHYFVWIDGRNYTLNKVNEEEKDFNNDDKSSSNQQIVKPPMPGNIVKIIAESGQKVSEGDPLIIVEAMKMETTIYASIDGIVKEINVKVGEQVDSEKILLLVERIEV